MRIAGVRLRDGAFAWVDVGESSVIPLGPVEIQVGESLVHGQVVITPEQMAGHIPQANAVLVSLNERTAGEDPSTDLPGADMPPLGTELDSDGVVVGIDAVKRTVTIERPNGEKSTRALT